jgi:uncharacterized surface protein with fasciclin (FAS1) repeats
VVDEFPGLPVMSVSERTQRRIATLVFASIGLTSGCSSGSSIDDASPAAAAEIGSGETPSVPASTLPAASPALPTLHELLAQDRFVPLGVALERGGLDTVIDGLDDFVLFAPTGTAFATSGADIGIEYSTLMNDPRLLEAILRYHIVADPSTNQSWRTLNGGALAIDGPDADTIKRVDSVDVLDRIPVRNGTVIVVPRLLLPALDPVVATTEQRND